MKNIFLFIFFLFSTITFSQNIQSPDKQLELTVGVNKIGRPYYSLNYKTKPVLQTSFLGVILKNANTLAAEFEILKTSFSTVNESWKPVLGEQKEIQNQYNQLIVELFQKSTKRKMNVVFRLFNEGLAFRYEFPAQPELN